MCLLLGRLPVEMYCSKGGWELGKEGFEQPSWEPHGKVSQSRTEQLEIQESTQTISGYCPGRPLPTAANSAASIPFIHNFAYS